MVEEEKVLVAKAVHSQDKMKVKVKRRVKGGYSGYIPDDYCKVINPKDYNDLALLFEDLEMMAGSPIEKAFRKFKERKAGSFPFY